MKRSAGRGSELEEGAGSRKVERALPVSTSGRLSKWASLVAVILSASFVTWHFMVSAALDGRKPSIFEVFGWVFWMTALAVLFIWACWVKTRSGWRWRWQRF
ncbi:MAG: hypothetical protein ACR2PI_21135 [Hyphomicrobiaceae bacterium]